MKKTLFLAIALFALSALSFGQVSLIPITLSSAVTTTSGNTVVVSAATGLNSNSYAIAAGTSYLWIDGEYMAVSAVNSTTLTVTRGYGGTRAETHPSGAYVFAGPALAFHNAKPGVLPQGSCTRANELFVPHVEISSQVVSDCIGGVWVTGSDAPYGQQQFELPFPNTGGTAYTSINTNGTTLSATTQYCTEVNLPYNKVLTGIGVLNGTTVTTDNHLVALYDSTGKLLANSATAGVVAASASTYQDIAFTSKYYAVGPAVYYACMQTNGTHATVRMIVTGTQDTYLTYGGTSVFGTLASFTAPTGFTTAVGPYVILY